MPPRLPQRRLLQSCVDTITHDAKARGSCVNWPAPATPQHGAIARFSTDPGAKPKTLLRQAFFDFLRTHGEQVREAPAEQGPNYIKPKFPPARGSFASNRPFPTNPDFISENVLSDELRERIWADVIREGNSIKEVSARYGVDVRRVSAVVRLKEVERQWEENGTPRAMPYAEAVMGMLPQTKLKPNAQVQHEPINEIHVHGRTMQQIWMPTSESRRFTREDAAKAFHNKMLSADERIPHPELVQYERDLQAGVAQKEALSTFSTNALASEKAWADQVRQRRERDEAATTAVAGSRYQYRFRDYNSEDVGKHGKRRHAVGWKYGVPLMDRRKGEVKIPTKVG